MAVESGNLRRDLMSKESVLYKNRKGDRLISAILYLLTPFAFMANPLLFVVCVTAQLVFANASRLPFFRTVCGFAS